VHPTQPVEFSAIFAAFGTLEAWPSFDIHAKRY